MEEKTDRENFGAGEGSGKQKCQKPGKLWKTKRMEVPVLSSIFIRSLVAHAPAHPVQYCSRAFSHPPVHHTIVLNSGSEAE